MAGLNAGPGHQIYGLVEGVLRAQKYLGLANKDKGILRRFLVKIRQADETCPILMLNDYSCN